MVQAAYKKHPYLLMLLVSLLLTLPWIFMGEFYTKGEPREATVAVDILNTGNWVLPSGYADEFAYKPPFMHWFIAAFSLLSGHVTEATSRLPSALGLVGIAMLFFSFLYKRKERYTALLATLLMLTSFEMHRSGIEARVDMFLSFFMVLALIQFYKWEEKRLIGFPWLISFAMAGAALVKGPVGILLPTMVFGIYLLLLQKYSLGRIVVKCIIVAIPSLMLALVWYVTAYQQGGERFLKLVFAENFGRFLGMDKAALGISYDLGHKGPFWYYIPALFLGFMPWSLIVLPGLFVVPFRKIGNSIRRTKLSTILKKISELDRVTLFSVIVLLVITGFYAIPSSKRSVYIIPVYPFAAYLLSKFYSWAMSFRKGFVASVHGLIVVFSSLVLLVVLIFAFVDLNTVATHLVHDKKGLNDVGLFAVAFAHPTVLSVCLWLVLLLTLCFSFISLRRYGKTAYLFSVIALMICLQVFLEGVAFPVFKNGYSIRPFAERIERRYKLKNSTYVVNDLDKYRNLYGLNFYLGNHFRNFEKEKPTHGYFVCGKKDFEKLKPVYSSEYSFTELEESANRFNDLDDVVILFEIKKLGTP